MKEKKTCFAGVSGGMDSFILVKNLEKTGYSVVPVYFSYGSVQEKREKEVVDSLYPTWVNVPVNFPIMDSKKVTLLGGSGTDYVPARNSIFIANLLCIAESMLGVSPANEAEITIALGVTQSGHELFPDTRPAYLASAAQMVSEATEGKVRLLTPFSFLTRSEVITLGVMSLKIVPEDLAKTYSCYKGEKVHCGLCHACRSRKKGFMWSIFDDPTEYKKEI